MYVYKSLIRDTLWVCCTYLHKGLCTISVTLSLEILIGLLASLSLIRLESQFKNSPLKFSFSRTVHFTKIYLISLGFPENKPKKRKKEVLMVRNWGMQS